MVPESEFVADPLRVPGFWVMLRVRDTLRIRVGLACPLGMLKQEGDRLPLANEVMVGDLGSSKRRPCSVFMLIS